MTHPYLKQLETAYKLIYGSDNIWIHQISVTHPNFSDLGVSISSCILKLLASRWVTGYWVLVSSILPNSTSGDLFHCQLVVFWPNWCPLRWCHLRFIINSCWQTLKALYDFDHTLNVVVLPMNAKQMCNIGSLLRDSTIQLWTQAWHQQWERFLGEELTMFLYQVHYASIDCFFFLLFLTEFKTILYSEMRWSSL